MNVTDPTGATLPAAGAPALGVLRERLSQAVLRDETAFGQVTVWLRSELLVEACTLLRDDPGSRYTLPLFVTAVDHPDREPREPRFDVVYQLRSLLLDDTCRLVVQVTEANPVVPTLSRHLAGMDWHEREAFDLLGILFEGHHDLRRILLPEDWEGHPLRRDYVSFGEPVAFTHNREWALPAQERPRDMPGAHR